MLSATKLLKVGIILGRFHLRPIFWQEDLNALFKETGFVIKEIRISFKDHDKITFFQLILNLFYDDDELIHCYFTGPM